MSDEKKLSDMTRDEIVSLIREAMVPANRYRRVDDALAVLVAAVRGTTVRVRSEDGVTDWAPAEPLIEELLAAIQIERGER